MEKDPIEKIEALTKEFHDYIERQGRGVFERYPLTFALLATFGVVLVGHGINAFVNSVPFLNNNPLLMFVVGLIILFMTGTLYKRLNKDL